MKLSELRKKNGLTQKQVASLVGIPYRTYIRYEEFSSYENTFKYNMIMKTLEDVTRVDEQHGILSVDKIKENLIPILKRNDIHYCYLFGSYARGEAKETSDIDLLVDTNIDGLDFFKLVENIRTSLNKKIDLLRLGDLTSNNPIVLEILKEGIRIL